MPFDLPTVAEIPKPDVTKLREVNWQGHGKRSLPVGQDRAPTRDANPGIRERVSIQDYVYAGFDGPPREMRTRFPDTDWGPWRKLRAGTSTPVPPGALQYEVRAVAPVAAQDTAALEPHEGRSTVRLDRQNLLPNPAAAKPRSESGAAAKEPTEAQK